MTIRYDFLVEQSFTRKGKGLIFKFHEKQKKQNFFNEIPSHWAKLAFVWVHEG